MDSHEGGEYDTPKRRNLRRLLSAFIARHLIQGDDDIARGTQNNHLVEQVSEALSEGLQEEYFDAIHRAQALLVAVREGRLPRHLANDPILSSFSTEDLSEAIERWVQIMDEHEYQPLEDLRINTEASAYYRGRMSEQGQLTFCEQVGNAERGLVDSLHEMIEPEEDD